MIIKNEPQQEPFLWIDFEINDFDHFTEVVHSWDIDFLQLDGGSFYSELKQMILAEVQNFLPIKFLKEIGRQIGCAENKIIQEKNMLYLEAKAYMYTHLKEPISVEEIAKKFKLSERSLRNYFKEELNTSPKQYLVTLRLTKIRGELQVLSMEKGLVEKTARRFGFHHMGQFSKVYKDFFGELPSQTLRQL